MMGFDYLVGAREQGRRHVEAERLGGFKIHDQVELDRCLHGKVFGFSLLRMRSTYDAARRSRSIVSTP